MTIDTNAAIITDCSIYDSIIYTPIVSNMFTSNMRIANKVQIGSYTFDSEQLGKLLTILLDQYTELKI